MERAAPINPEIRTVDYLSHVVVAGVSKMGWGRSVGPIETRTYALKMTVPEVLRTLDLR